MLRDTREIRVTAFQQFVQDLATYPPNRDNSAEAAFVVGYVASRMAPGTLEYFRLLRPLEPLVPGVLVWYGMCAALQSDDFIAGSGGVGRRIYRDFVAAPTFPDRPRADISVWDLDVFSHSENSPVSMVGSSSFSVELLPDVVCLASSKSQAPVKPYRQMTSEPQLLYDRDLLRDDPSTRESEPTLTTQELASLREELRQVLTRVDSVRYKLERMTSRADAPRKGRPRK